MKLKTLTRPLEIKAVNDDGTFEGYGSVFNNIDAYRDIVLPGAFAKSIKKHLKAGTMPALLWQHDPTTPIGVWDSMQEDEHGLKMTGRLLVNKQVPNADGAHALLKAGAVKGLSIGYSIPEGGAEWDEKDEVLKLAEVNLWETSIVTFPANDQAQVTDVRCALAAGIYPTTREFEAWLMRDAGFTKKDAQTVITEGFKALVTRDADDGLDTITQLLRGMKP